jgi:hypothetical protein
LVCYLGHIERYNVVERSKIMVDLVRVAVKDNGIVA